MGTLEGKGEMEAFGLLKKSGPPRYKSNPLEQAVDSDDDNGNEVYTPVVDDAGSKANTRESQAPPPPPPCSGS